MPAYKDKERDTWYVKFNYVNWEGKSVQKKKRGFATKKEAQDWEHLFLAKERAESSITMNKLADIYIADMETRLRVNSMINKKRIIRTLVLPYFENKPISDVTPVDIRRWQSEMIKRGYSDKHLKLIQSQMSAMMNYAVNFFNLPENPCRKAGPMGGNEQKEMDFWTKDEFRQFMQYIERPDTELAFMLLFWTGVRIGELMALTPEDVNTKNKTIRINKCFYRVQGKDYVAEPKTKKSNRTVTIPAFLNTSLENYIKQRELKKEDKLFPFSKYHLRYTIKVVCNESGVKQIRLHDFRHSHASMLIEMNCSPLLISERLGHENVETTLKVYSHLYPNKQAEVAEKLNEIASGLW